MTKVQLEQRILRCQRMLKQCTPHLDQLDELSKGQINGAIILLNNWRIRHPKVSTKS